MVAVFFFMCAMAFAAAAVFFMFLCVMFPTSARDFFFFFHNWLVLFSAKLRTPSCNWVAKERDEGRGDEYCGGQATLKIQQGHGPKRWPCSLRVRGPHFASKVSYNAGAATDDCAGQCKYQKGVHQKIPMYTFIYNIICLSRSKKLRCLSLRHQHLLSVDEVDALRQGNEARAFHISVVETDA